MTASSPRTKLAPWMIRPGTRLYTEQLSAELYKDPGHSVVELVKNACVACMAEDGTWDPTRIVADVSYVRSHPLTGTDAICIFDAGCGFTQPNIERFCVIGRDREQSRFGGAAQKGIGRLACFALKRDRYDPNGFIVLTRTSARGSILLAAVTPSALADQHIHPELLEPDATELGTLCNHVGRFTCIIIPEPVLRSHDAIREAAAPWLPRVADRCGRLTISGKPFTPPPLANTIVIPPPEGGPRVEAFLARTEHAAENGGIWLVDAATGFRTAFCPTIGNQLPYPLGRPDFTGDIFVDGLLDQQDASRSTLRGQYFKSAAWRQVRDYLRGIVTPQLLALLDDSDVVTNSPIGKLLDDDLRSLFEQAWGKPDTVSVPPPDDSSAFPGPNPGPKNPGPRNPGGGNGKPGGPKKPKPRYIALKIGDETWTFGTMPDDPARLAIVHDAKGRRIYVNTQYACYPTSPTARTEHVLLQVLLAIAETKHPESTDLAMRFASERLMELRESGRRTK